jgi:Protein of unknown function (DUF3617)
MRKAIWFGGVLLATTILLADTTYQPLNVKTGLWQVTGTNSVGGSQHAISYKKCITTDDLNSNPWMNGPEEKCTWTVVTSTTTDMEVQGTACEMGKNYGMKTDIDLKLHASDTEDVNATLQGTMTGNGRTINFNGTLTGKWVSASCS